MTDLHERVLTWYDEHARDLPWRAPSRTPWAVMVSEFMLQQTPVSRVLPVYEAWLDAVADTRRPGGRTHRATPCGCGGGSATRAGHCGCTRRQPPSSSSTTARCRVARGAPGLPGVGEYTAAAIASFAYRQRHAVLDTNVRRVLARR